MSYTKVHENRISGSKGQGFYGFSKHMGVEAIWSCNQQSHFLLPYIHNFVKKAKWFLLLALKFDIYVRQICQGQSMGIIYTHYDVLDVDATYKVSCIGPVVLENILKGS